MQLMIVGEHELGRWKEIREKVSRIFNQPPPGVRILHRYATLNGNLTFAIIEAEREEEVAKLMTELSAMSRYTVYPIYEVGEREQAEVVKEESFDSMHGPI
ncbi:MAG: hypothetical protein A2Z08_05390 [Deltaproteobacteria bacterium RBG_16_54_11]|nr:MAG: hypothetical protein A2Z08_05390 [Deltaproteobacteria bacterium RBG_16_54_11]